MTFWQSKDLIKWLEDESYIYKSPLRRIHKIKLATVVRETYADEDVEKLRDDCKILRNLAIIDLLNSTGIRVGELVNVHPHKFRRTMATTAIDRGMPIEQVQRLLGHEKIDTTLRYAMVKQSNVKLSHKKYMS